MPFDVARHDARFITLPIAFFNALALIDVFLTTRETQVYFGTPFVIKVHA